MKRPEQWEKNIIELVRRTSTDLPADVEAALRRALKKEKRGSHAQWVLESILENVAVARKQRIPLCQDTGSLLFYCSVPVGFDTNALAAVARTAVSKATRYGHLRENTVDSVSGASYQTNVAHASPVFHFEQGARKTVDVRLIMKGGGSENMGCQYSLPDPVLGLNRDLKGVRTCILDAVWKAQGNACPPCVVGVCIGGDRTTGYFYSKEQFLRRIGERPSVKALAKLERRVLEETQKLGIGPMGLGGRTTLLDVKIGAVSRIPASYFVTISFMCWAYRRRGVLLGPEGGVQRWLY